MAWHHQYFPTVHRVARWYWQRDIFERIGINVVAWVGVIWYVYIAFLAPPLGFPSAAYINVEEGMTLREVSRLFEEREIINNARLFEIVTRILGDDEHIVAGFYHFSQKDNLVWVAMRLLTGDFETNPARVTIPEGATAREIADILVDEVPGFNKEEFLNRAREGYLFPDTYFFRPGQSTEAILSVFENNFRVKILRTQNPIISSGHTLDEIITMASILEKEASKTADRKQIAGVLWHRIEIGMPLQVDATFPYYLGRNTFEVTREDLAADHPYNTYTNKGLPAGPIGNPGLDAILAAAQPTKTNYVYFLSDRDGNFHYSVTYEGHLANKRKYID
jgi:UPF0755 protein